MLHHACVKMQQMFFFGPCGAAFRTANSTRFPKGCTFKSKPFCNVKCFNLAFQNRICNQSKNLVVSQNMKFMFCETEVGVS